MESGWKTNRLKKRTWHGKEIDRWRKIVEWVWVTNCVDALNRDNTHFQSKLCENDAKSMVIHYIGLNICFSFFSHFWFAFFMFFSSKQNIQFLFLTHSISIISLYLSSLSHNLILKKAVIYNFFLLLCWLFGKIYQFFGRFYENHRVKTLIKMVYYCYRKSIRYLVCKLS